MKVIKNGKRINGSYRMKCYKCGCKFEADVSDYVFVKSEKIPPINGYIPTENNVPSDTIACNCPNCGKEVTKNIYAKHNSDLGEILTALSLFLTMIICAVTGLVSIANRDLSSGIILLIPSIMSFVSLLNESKE